VGPEEELGVGSAELRTRRLARGARAGFFEFFGTGRIDRSEWGKDQGKMGTRIQNPEGGLFTANHAKDANHGGGKGN